MTNTHTCGTEVPKELVHKASGGQGILACGLQALRGAGKILGLFSLH